MAAQGAPRGLGPATGAPRTGLAGSGPHAERVGEGRPARLPCSPGRRSRAVLLAPRGAGLRLGQPAAAAVGHRAADRSVRAAASLAIVLAGVLIVAPAGRLAAAPVTRLPAEAAPAPPTPQEAEQVHAIAAQLRCVVCQALSVADSPSTTAAQMRGVILEQLREGRSPDEVKAYFVSRYGEWVLLAPTRSGFNLLAWWLPFVGIGAGLVGVLIAARRWVARGRQTAAARAEPSPADRERLARELEELGR